MKRICFFLLAMLTFGTVFYAQSTSDIRKEREAINKMSQTELNKKATKSARKEAKQLKKDGWQITPGALPIEKQLEKSYLMQYESDSDLMPKYIFGEAMSIGSNYDAAKMQALELAKQSLAGQIQTEVTALIENTVSNEQLGAEEAVSITQTVMASKNLISQRIGRTIPVVEVYRTLSNKNKEVLVRIAYSSEEALNIAKSVVKEELKAKGDNLHNKIDNIINK